MRKFILSFYFNDNSLMIYEPEGQNTGFKSGKFLERGIYRNEQGLLIRRTFVSTG